MENAQFFLSMYISQKQALKVTGRMQIGWLVGWLRLHINVLFFLTKESHFFEMESAVNLGSPDQRCSGFR